MKNESGRTMIEMLGVLAIIGILSVTGISMYNYALTQHKVNEIMQSIAIANQDMQVGHGAIFLPVKGVTFTAQEFNGAQTFVQVTVDDRTVCEKLKSQAAGQWIVEGDCS